MISACGRVGVGIVNILVYSVHGDLMLRSSKEEAIGLFLFSPWSAVFSFILSLSLCVTLFLLTFFSNSWIRIKKCIMCLQYPLVLILFKYCSIDKLAAKLTKFVLIGLVIRFTYYLNKSQFYLFEIWQDLCLFKSLDVLPSKYIFNYYKQREDSWNWSWKSGKWFFRMLFKDRFEH